VTGVGNILKQGFPRSRAHHTPAPVCCRISTTPSRSFGPGPGALRGRAMRAAATV